MSADERAALTTPDLVVLSLLCERPMHGYDVQRELVRRDVHDWAGISRPQIYYSLKKLRRARLIREKRNNEPALGPDRRVFAPTKSAKAALAQALEAPAWAENRPPPPFVTWLCLSPHTGARARRSILEKRRRFLEGELAKERRTLVAVQNDRGPLQAIAFAVVSYGIQQFELELAWLTQFGPSLFPTRGSSRTAPPA